jgi:hypothetical protein
MSEQAQIKSNRTQLLLLLGITVISVLGASLLFQSARSGGVWGTTNKGTFVQPPVVVADLRIRDEPGSLLTGTGNWWVWVVPQGECVEDCRHALHQLRQLHVLLHRDAGRVRRALVEEGAGGAEAELRHADLIQLYPELALLSGEVTTLARGIYIVDPIGNLVLHYRMEDAGKPVLEDLKRLLKVSQIG